jgi:hypothetical protein
MRSLAGRCNASATDPRSVSEGSNPPAAALKIFLFAGKMSLMRETLFPIPQPLTVTQSECVATDYHNLACLYLAICQRMEAVKSRRVTHCRSVSLGSNPGSATFLFICKAAVMEKARWRSLSLAESPKYVSSCYLTLVGVQLLTSPVIV